MSSLVDGLRWEVRSRGSGRPLLLLHGFTGRGASWAEHVAAFARPFRTIVVDLPGHGRSGTAGPERMSVERAADDLAELLAGEAARPAHVLGYSLGARVALRSPCRTRTPWTASCSRAPRRASTGEERAARRAADERWRNASNATASPAS